MVGSEQRQLGERFGGELRNGNGHVRLRVQANPGGPRNDNAQYRRTTLYAVTGGAREESPSRRMCSAGAGPDDARVDVKVAITAVDFVQPGFMGNDHERAAQSGDGHLRIRIDANSEPHGLRHS